MSADPASSLHVFLITDVRGYTDFTDRAGDESGAQLAQAFAGVVRSIVTPRQGRLLQLRGDEAVVVFDSARQALRAAVELQAEARKPVPGVGVPIPIGVGLDAGEAVPVDDGFRGSALNRASRLCSLARTGEILAAEAVVHLAGTLPGITLQDRGMVRLKGFSEPTRVLMVGESTAPAVEADAGKASQVTGVFLGAQPPAPLVGRRAQLERLLGAESAVKNGEGRCLLLEGEPGIGKTRLAQELAGQLAADRFVIGAGRCYAPQRSVPFYPFLDALSALYASAPQRIPAEAPRLWPYLARLLPDQVVAPIPPASGGEDEQQRLFRAVAAFIQALAVEAPVAIMLDDLHWADAASIDLFLHLTRHTRSHAVLLLGTYRPAEVDQRHPLRAALLDLEHEQLVDIIALEALDRNDTSQLINSLIGEVTAEFVDTIQERTEGNPLFIRELLRALPAGTRSPAAQTIRDMDVPESVRGIVEQRLAGLRETARQVLQEASVLGQSFRFDDLEGLAGLREVEVEQVLDEAASLGLVRESGEDTYSFSHALIQQAVYATIPARRRRRLHGAAGQMLEAAAGERSGKPAQLAWHYLQAHDAARAVRWSLAAGDEAETVFAHAEAEHHYRNALQLATESDDEEHERLALEKLGTVLGVGGRHDEALRLLLQAADMYRRASDLEGQARVAARMGLIHHARGTAEEGVDRLQDVLHDLGSAPPSRGLCLLYLALSRLLALLGRHQEAIVAAQRAAELSATLPDARVQGEAKALLGAERLLSLQQEEALSDLEEAISLAEITGDTETLFLALDTTSEATMLQGHLTESISRRQRAIELVERAGDLHKLAYELTGLGDARYYLGDWETAERQYSRAAELAQSWPGTWLAAFPATGLAMVALARGIFGEVEKPLGDSIGVAQATGNAQALTRSAATLAEWYLLTDHASDALALLEPLLGRPDALDWYLVAVLPRAAWAYLVIGNRTAAKTCAEQAVQRAAAVKNEVVGVEALRVLGMAQVASERVSEGLGTLLEAADRARRVNYPYAEGRAKYEFGVAALAHGDADAGRQQLDEAAAIFRRLGANFYAARAAGASGR